jgi:uncharacterized damage-inducible protein DinB
MDIATLRTLYDYHYWARDRMLGAADSLTPGQFTQSKGHSFDTVQGTLVHLMNSERLWLRRWRGEPVQPPLKPADFPMVDGVRMYWESLEMQMRKFLDDLGEAGLARVVRYTNSQGVTLEFPVWQMLLHVITHGAHHRSEAATMLTELGHAPEPLDLIVYFRIASGQD